MKIPPPFILLAAIFALSPLVHAQGTSVQVRVEQETKQEFPNLKDRHTKTQKRTLKVFLTSSSKEDANVKIKYTYFGHPEGGHDTVAVSQGDKDVTLKPSVTQEEDVPTASVTYVEEHYPPAKPGSAAKVIPASGNKLTGYGVQIFEGDKLVGESYEPLSMKEEMNKAPAAKTAAPPKK
jgi:hypothetical protein